MITAIAIDDEPKALEVIQHHVSKYDCITLLACLSRAEDGWEFLKQNPVDVVFLDINMPHLSGFQLLEKLQRMPLVIFTTAYADYAAESYNYNAVDYLLKPFDFERFQVAVDKTKKRLEEFRQQKHFIFVKDGIKNIKIEFENIFFVKGSGNYLDILTDKKCYSPRMTFSELIEKLPSTQFVRIHQSYLVNIDQIQKIENNHVYLGEHKIPISNRYKHHLFSMLDLR